jgi:glycosyltransferase involved in cell wall biosynthesis/SAM-dependent methyltransferase
MEQKVLFISHDGYRHGAQMLLLHVIRWFKENTTIPFEILLKDGNGGLRSDFEALGRVQVWYREGDATSNDHYRQLLQYYRAAPIGLIYANTITNGPVLAGLADIGCPVITNVHELEYCIQYRMSRENNQQILACTTHFIAGSQAVKKYLVEGMGVASEKVDVVYECIPTQHYQPDSLRAQYAQFKIRQELKIPPKAPIVGGSGTTDWRKGVDMFVPLALAVYKRPAHQRTHFVWVGGENAGPNWGALQYDAKHCGLEAYVHFAGAHTNWMDYEALFDVFTLPSREDPFPLVNLEAATLGKPIVCFEGSGGTQEFVEDDIGFVVPYLDVEAMAEKVCALLESPDLRKRFGERARKKVRERHDISVAGPQILGIMQKLMGRKNSPGAKPQSQSTPAYAGTGKTGARGTATGKGTGKATAELSNVDLQKKWSGLNDNAWLDAVTQKYLREQNGEGVQDGLPSFPPDDLQKRTTGLSGAETIKEAFVFYQQCMAAFTAFGRSKQKASRLLDFWAGWGRVSRLFLREFPLEKIYGVDIDPEYIEVCKRSFRSENFSECSPFPPLSFENGFFDLLIGYSAFSHLSEKACLAWTKEFSRVLAPGGIAILATRSRSFLDTCQSMRGETGGYPQALSRLFKDFRDARRRYDHGEFVHSNIPEVTGGGVRTGAFYGESFIPEAYAKKAFSEWLDLKAYIVDPNIRDQAVLVFTAKPT